MTQLDHDNAAGGYPEPESGATPRLRKSERRRAEIVREARRLFEAKGFHNTSLDDIAREVGIKREGLYYYFRNPADILMSIVRPRIERLIARLALIVEADMHPESKLYLAIHGHLRLFDRTSLDTIALGSHGDRAGPAGSVHGDMRPLYKRYQDLWVQLVEQGRAAKAFAEIGPPKMIVFAILGMCNWMGRWYDPAKPVQLDEVAEIFFAVSGNGVIARSRNGAHRKGSLPRARRAEVEAFLARHGAP